MNYKDTLNLPVTDFPMRGNLGQKEPTLQATWESMQLYKKGLEHNQDGPTFVLHDGPPYANGDIHIGHAMNKILKDFVLRYKTMRGYYTRYIPGWDTHGLPIETALAKKGIKRKDMPMADYRNLCRDYAYEQIHRQKEQFKRLGILGEWDDPYITLKPEYESDQIKVFANMVDKGLIYKGLKPVFWSPSSETALAEAEIEYKDVEDTSIYVAFKAKKVPESLKNASFIIWTTTPWTLPANRAISVHPNFNYVHVLADKQEYVIAEELMSHVKNILSWQDVKILQVLKGKSLEYMTYIHPLFDLECPIILGEHVTAEDGSGLVHTAPGHGEDDYIVGKQYDLEVFCPVDERGYMMASAEKYEGLFYKEANEQIINDLKIKQTLLNATRFIHAYPHDWRTQKPVIFRATPQWFASIKAIKEPLSKAIKDVTWFPSWGETRLSNMVEAREDWCISRQRAWGVPIPVFYAENGEAILDQEVLMYVADLFEKHGSNIWFEKDANDLLPTGYTHPGSPNNTFKKETDIMDVWFDSGTSYMTLNRYGVTYPADLYLEGSDQYRGWFNSSLSTSIAAFNETPYLNVVSHGFVLDGNGRKMSKSLGNTVDPVKVMDQMGADLLRLWVATTDYQQDVRISDDTLKQIGEGYRKIRNTLRYMLGNLADFNVENDYIGYSMRGNLNRAMTLKLSDLYNQVIDAYETYQFDKVYRVIMPFIINDLSAFYLDFTKDLLYTSKKQDVNRRSVQSTIFDILLSLLKVLTPIMPHTTSEAYEHLNFDKKEDVYLERLSDPNVMEEPFQLRDALDALYVVRDEVNQALEQARNDKHITKSMQASITLELPQATLDQMLKLGVDLKEIFMVAEVKIIIQDTLKATLTIFEGHTCERCWNVYEKVNEHQLCKRCEDVIKELS